MTGAEALVLSRRKGGFRGVLLSLALAIKAFLEGVAGAREARPINAVASISLILRDQRRV